MIATMKNIDHGTSPGDVVTRAPDLRIFGELQEITKVLRLLVEGLEGLRSPVEVRVPLPEFHNEVAVSPTPIEVQAPRVDNHIVVSPTPVELHPRIVVESTPPDIVINLDVKAIVNAIHLLVGVFGAFAVGILISLFWNHS